MDKVITDPTGIFVKIFQSKPKWFNHYRYLKSKTASIAKTPFQLFISVYESCECGQINSKTQVLKCLAYPVCSVNVW